MFRYLFFIFLLGVLAVFIYVLTRYIAGHILKYEKAKIEAWHNKIQKETDKKIEELDNATKRATEDRKIRKKKKA